MLDTVIYQLYRGVAMKMIGEIRICPIAFVPKGWAECDGRLLNIRDNSALYSLLGTTYGGDGKTTFALPDLRGRVPMGQGEIKDERNFQNGKSWQVGQELGSPGTVLQEENMPSHTHSAEFYMTKQHCNVKIPVSSQRGEENSPAGNYLARSAQSNYIDERTSSDEECYLGEVETSLDISANVTIDTKGFDNPLPISNYQPSLCLRFIIALDGDYPSRS